MAIATVSNVVIYPEEFHSGATEVIAQETDTFNAASGGAIVLRSLIHQGDYIKESFFNVISGLVSRRDNTSVADATDTEFTSVERAGVKLNRTIGPVAITLDAWRKMNQDPGLFSFSLGQQIGKAIMVDYINTAIRAMVAAIKGQSASLLADVTGETVGTLTHEHLVTGQSKLGDKGTSFSCILTHSKSYYDMTKSAITTASYRIGDVTIFEGASPTFNRPTVVTDSADLHFDNTGTENYYTLILVPNAIEISESEERTLINQTITGKANLFERIQGEHAFTINLMGYTYDYSNGGANPNDTALSTSTNWDLIATSVKDTGGSMIQSL